MRRCKRWLWSWWIGCLALGGCAYYSFTGASIPSHLQTIAIPLVEDRSTSPFTNLDQQLTDLLIERFVNQTRLTLEPDLEAADALLAVRIERYTNEPTAIGGAERAERNRVTITVSVRYVDQVNDQVLLQRSFSAFEEYDPVAQGLAGEEEAARLVLRNLADDIFTAATSNW
ncbi:LptE family protein [Rhodothermus profundi]|uniref:Lipopolysaccharide-assembly n=1 Tax=Rhodothermus profundi TaxID=633813 RepID=A0A1M6UBY4_9BACT|nr:LptE family protein [Rhodothermus profundi]SHK66681.1 Lipopolysaccharide-assembly [Rhodothermus profundi]